jgi:hypothetical protein
MNFISNALKFTLKSGQIKIYLRLIENQINYKNDDNNNDFDHEFIKF